MEILIENLQKILCNLTFSTYESINNRENVKARNFNYLYTYSKQQFASSKCQF